MPRSASSVYFLRSPLPSLAAADPLPRAIAVVGFLVIYPLLAASSGRFAGGDSISPWYPASGLALAFLMAGGARLAPLLLVAILLGAVIGGPVAMGFPSLLLLALAKSGTWGLAAAAMRRPWRYRDPWHPGNTLRLLMVAIAAPVPIALLSVRVAGTDPFSGAGRDRALALWLGDANSVLTVAPFVLLLFTLTLGPLWRQNTPAVPMWGRWPTGVIAAQILTASAAVLVAWQAGPGAGAERHYM
jgi:hypothetical protein